MGATVYRSHVGILPRYTDSREGFLDGACVGYEVDLLVSRTIHEKLPDAIEQGIARGQNAHIIFE